MFALLLAVRRQWHQELTAADSAIDATERRVTELYTKAVEQLGADKAPVRLGSLYALERLAQDHPAQRQTIVNVFCAYLRMPCVLPGDVDEKAPSGNRERVEEREVRLTVQRLLTAHLQLSEYFMDASTDSFWPDIDLDLDGATLIDFSLSWCKIRAASFIGANFIGVTGFDGTQFTGRTWFDKAQFAGHVVFERAQFTGDALFNQAQFAGDAWFDNVQFAGNAWFSDAKFTGTTSFSESWFTNITHYDGAHFTGQTSFRKVQFTSSTSFKEVQFTGPTSFEEVQLSPHTWFGDAQFTGDIPVEVGKVLVPASQGRATRCQRVCE